ncbi:MAG: zinc ABC transporter substrate-binding protein [Chlamydiia bacterium]|nr:zinc ABC transporter substrate-binding protein [Chlamydiia bacterium]
MKRDKPIVLVSLAPYEFIVKKIAGEKVAVQVMVPAGVSIHSFEPSPKAFTEATQADLWFIIGEVFELRVKLPVKQVDLRKGVDQIGGDLHFWLGPSVLAVQSQTIAGTLKEAYPEYAEEFETNLQQWLQELDAAKQPFSKRPVIMLSHPALAYFCRDFNCEQVSIEMEGKEPHARQMVKLIDWAKKKQVELILVEPQHSQKGARRIAEAIGAKVVEFDPYQENVLQTWQTLKELME